MYFELFILSRKLPRKPLVESISFGLLAPFQISIWSFLYKEYNSLMGPAATVLGQL